MKSPQAQRPAKGEARPDPALLQLPSFSASPWQMSFGERAVIEGVLAQLRPRLALEIGTAEGGSLDRIAAHSDRVISFDLVEPQPEAKALANVQLRTGDSHVLLPRELERLAAVGEPVDFVLIDGDHTAEGARRDMEDVLASGALRRGMVLAHDTLNQDVRRGLDEVPYGEIDKVAFIDLDFVGGYVPAEPPLRGECWGGLGLVIVDDGGDFGPPHEGRRPQMTPLPQLVWAAADDLRGATNSTEPAGAEHSAAAEAEVDRSRQLVEEMQSSLSWRITAPLRAAGSRMRRR